MFVWYGTGLGTYSGEAKGISLIRPFSTSSPTSVSVALVESELVLRILVINSWWLSCIGRVFTRLLLLIASCGLSMLICGCATVVFAPNRVAR